MNGIFMNVPIKNRKGCSKEKKRLDLRFNDESKEIIGFCLFK
jgi:hypothetical protein